MNITEITPSVLELKSQELFKMILQIASNKHLTKLSKMVIASTKDSLDKEREDLFLLSIPYNQKRQMLIEIYDKYINIVKHFIITSGITIKKYPKFI
jgi:hypothetical protein